MTPWSCLSPPPPPFPLLRPQVAQPASIDERASKAPRLDPACEVEALRERVRALQLENEQLREAAAAAEVRAGAAELRAVAAEARAAEAWAAGARTAEAASTIPMAEPGVRSLAQTAQIARAACPSPPALTASSDESNVSTVIRRADDSMRYARSECGRCGRRLFAPARDEKGPGARILSLNWTICTHTCMRNCGYIRCFVCLRSVVMAPVSFVGPLHNSMSVESFSDNWPTSALRPRVPDLHLGLDRWSCACSRSF